MSKKQLAARIGIHPATLGRWFNRDAIWSYIGLSEQEFKKRHTLTPYQAREVLRYYFQQ